MMTMTENIPLTESMTLAQRMGEGPLPAAEAIRYALQLADALSRLREAGRAHGAVTPASLALVAGTVELLPAAEGSCRTITPYTAPEVVQGRAADARSDLFSFGAIVFEMLTGRRAFDGESRAALAANLTQLPVPSTGSAAIDRVVGPCLSKDPIARSVRMQKLMLELKVLSVAARRGGAAWDTERRGGSPENGVSREEMQHLEARMAARLQAHERAVAAMQRSATEAINSLRSQVTVLSSELAGSYQLAGQRSGGVDDAAEAAIQARVDRGFEVLDTRMVQLERTADEIRRHVSQFEHSVAADLVDIERNIKVHGTAIESSRTAMSQTDDLVERVVEALESLQTTVLDQDEGNLRASFAVN
jgi:hypothetical protein